MTALTLHRARAAGALATRERLGAALGWWRADPASEDDWLVVPRLQLAFRAGRSQAPDAFAREFGRALEKERGRARIDPPPGEQATGPIKFSRASRWHTWLAGAVASAQSGTTMQQQIEMAQKLREEVLGKPVLLLAVAQQLARVSLLAGWCAQLDAADCEQVIGTLVGAAGQVPTHVFPFVEAGLLDARFGHRHVTGAIAAERTRETLAQIEVVPGLPARNTLQGLAARALLAVIVQPPLAAIALIVLRAQHARGGDFELEAAPTQELAEISAPSAKRTVLSPHRASGLPRPAMLVSSALPLSPPREAPPNAADRIEQVRREQEHPGAVAAQPIAPPTAPLIAADLRFDTDFAGVLFLLNSFIALDLYPDFTRPLGSRLAPSPSWLLGQVGRRLLGPAFGRDSLYSWLTNNAQPGRLPDVWQIAEDWEPDRARSRRYRSGELAVDWDRRGFFAGIHRIGRRGASRVPAPRHIARLLPHRAAMNAVWLSGFVEYLRYRLNQADVGLSDLRLRGTIALVEGDLTALIALADLPIAVRMAGLDRDPGWLPAEGRVLRFEFV